MVYIPERDWICSRIPIVPKAKWICFRAVSYTHLDVYKRQVENWKEAYKNNTGLLLFGDVGTGKSFFAGCIANALLDRDVPVLMTNFPTILNRLTGMFSDDRADFIASFDEYDLRCV